VWVLKIKERNNIGHLHLQSIQHILVKVKIWEEFKELDYKLTKLQEDYPQLMKMNLKPQYKSDSIMEKEHQYL